MDFWLAAAVMTARTPAEFAANALDQFCRPFASEPSSNSSHTWRKAIANASRLASSPQQTNNSTANACLTTLSNCHSQTTALAVRCIGGRTDDGLATLPALRTAAAGLRAGSRALGAGARSDAGLSGTLR